MLLNLQDPRDVELIVDERVARLRAPARRPERGSQPLRARIGQALIALGTALAGEAAKPSVRRPTRPAGPARSTSS
jgi:hypothetical protein